MTENTWQTAGGVEYRLTAAPSSSFTVSCLSKGQHKQGNAFECAGSKRTARKSDRPFWSQAWQCRAWAGGKPAEPLLLHGLLSSCSSTQASVPPGFCSPCTKSCFCTEVFPTLAALPAALQSWQLICCPFQLLLAAASAEAPRASLLPAPACSMAACLLGGH